MFKQSPSNPSREGIALRFMREEKKLSLPIVAQMTGIRAAVIDHMENGRKILTAKDIEIFLLSYGFDQKTFSELLEIKLLNKQAANLYFLKQKN
jgi:transcriptional regulator with XRE-family HTH domain